eukprot:TRINITY_DN70266_c0_g1_i1.p1 TRINITY_DN70266_c0_g1~~TRINITY_DN70266_c0_g1_i1.p1  ORF type:complete len:327 (+),score=87.75 TRINITY_DN70266_c0_g1_i1:90-983(+)
MTLAGTASAFDPSMMQGLQGLGGGGANQDPGAALLGMLGQLAGGLDQANGAGGRKGGRQDPRMAKEMDDIYGQKQVCKSGKVPVPKLNMHTMFRANGCGPQGFQIPEDFGLYKCCNGHDVCFTACGTSHQYCEDSFKQCMSKVCENPLKGGRKKCREQADSFTSLTKSFGGGFHLQSQKESCDCVKESKAQERHKQYLKHFYEKFNKTAAADHLIDAELKEWNGKVAELYDELVRRYGNKFVKFDNVDGRFYEGDEAQKAEAQAKKAERQKEKEEMAKREAEREAQKKQKKEKAKEL